MSSTLKFTLALLLVSCEEQDQDLIKPLASQSCPLAEDATPLQEDCTLENAEEVEWGFVAALLDQDEEILDREEWDGMCARVTGVVEVNPEDPSGQYTVSFSGGQDPNGKHVLMCCPSSDWLALQTWGAVKNGERVVFWGRATGDSVSGYSIESCTIVR